MSGFIGAMLEAWDELRIHKMRVLLSLLGVAVAVAGMTAVSALMTTSAQVQREMMERESGREGTVMVWLPNPGKESLEWMREANAEFAEFIERNEIPFASRRTWGHATFRGSGIPIMSELMVVDRPYGVMHRIELSRGSWFTTNNDDRLAPPIVVNEAFLRETGEVGTELPFTIDIELGESQIKNTVIVQGVIPDRWEWESARAFMLNSSYMGIIDRAAKPGLKIETGEPELELWVGGDLMWEADRAIKASLGPKGATSVIQEYGWIEESTRLMALAGYGVTGLVLGLAALNLLTISMVTLRGRIREIGIRRAFGATSGRVFFAVMMESLVATVIAGAIGVGITAALFNNLPIDQYLMGGMRLQDPVPFPAQAGLLGLAVATGVGALAGLVPALVAVRVRPIDAIRF